MRRHLTPRLLHIQGCMYYLSPIELRILKRLMPDSEFVTFLTTEPDYEVTTEAQLKKLQQELLAIPLDAFSKIPYPRGQHICPRTEADLVEMLKKAAGLP